MSEGAESVEQMEAFARDHGLAALLDHIGLDGLGNEVVAMRAEVERLRKAGDYLAVVAKWPEDQPTIDRAVSAWCTARDAS